MKILLVLISAIVLGSNAFAQEGTKYSCSFKYEEPREVPGQEWIESVSDKGIFSLNIEKLPANSVSKKAIINLPVTESKLEFYFQNNFSGEPGFLLAQANISKKNEAWPFILATKFKSGNNFVLFGTSYAHSLKIDCKTSK